MPPGNKERHRTGRIGWLRAAVLGANDGILSTSSLLLGVAAAHATHSNVLVAGAMSMAAGEYVAVRSQADTEQAGLALERAELKADDKGEHKELMAIYVARGRDPALAKQVAEQLMAHDALGAHARDELGISETLRARPIQAAMASAGSFAWRSHASLGQCHNTDGGADSPCLWNFTGVPRPSRRVGCTRRRRRSDSGSDTSHVLGCTGHGADRRSRGTVRNSRVSRANPRLECG